MVLWEVYSTYLFFPLSGTRAKGVEKVRAGLTLVTNDIEYYIFVQDFVLQGEKHEPKDR